MQRRQFLNSVAATTAGTLAMTAGTPEVRADNQEPSAPQCKVTVLRVSFNEDWNREYRNESAGPCPVFQEGQEFILSSPYMHPDGFCHWAWADIRTFVQAVYFGQSGPVVACCTDGIRPVFFRIERID